jgi:ABC-type branched-subunit amino acid transport system substrate-binding protein
MRFISKVIRFLSLTIAASVLQHNIAFADSESKHTYKIGAVLPLSGPMSFAGGEVRDAINLGLSEIGETRFKYEVVFEDNGTGAVATASAVRKLLDQDHADAIVTLWPEAANVAAPITEQRGVLHYTIAWDPQIACTNKFILSHQVMVDDYARATLKLLKSHNARHIAFFHDSVFQQGADILEKLAPEFGIKIQKTYTFDRGKTDFRSELTHARTHQATGFLIWSIMPETEIFLKQVQELQIKTFISGFFDVVQNLSMIEGLPFVSEVYGTPEFQEKFANRFGHSTTMKGPNAYDVIRILVSAVEDTPGNPPNAESLKQQLVKVSNYLGAVGVISIDKCGNSAYPVVTKVVRQGKLTTSSEEDRTTMRSYRLNPR